MSHGSSVRARITSCRAAIVLFAVALAAPAEAKADLIVSSVDGVVYRVGPNGDKTVLASGLGQPHEVEVDSLGNTYVAEVNGDRVTRISPAGVKTVLFAFDSPSDN